MYSISHSSQKQFGVDTVYTKLSVADYSTGMGVVSQAHLKPSWSWLRFLQTMKGCVCEQTQHNQTDRLTWTKFAVKNGSTMATFLLSKYYRFIKCWFLLPQLEHSYFTETLTTLSLVSGYDTIGHDVEDCKQEEANLKRQHKNVTQGFTMTVDESVH